MEIFTIKFDLEQQVKNIQNTLSKYVDWSSLDDLSSTTQRCFNPIKI